MRFTDYNYIRLPIVITFNNQALLNYHFLLGVIMPTSAETIFDKIHNKDDWDAQKQFLNTQDYRKSDDRVQEMFYFPDGSKVGFIGPMWDHNLRKDKRVISIYISNRMLNTKTFEDA